MSRRPLLTGVALLAACTLPAGPVRQAADVRGAWSFTAEQQTPVQTLEGTLIVEAQHGDLITGSVSWQSRDTFGVTQLGGGPLNGRVIAESDVDFDVLLDGVARRHVARLAADTMRGSWVQLFDGRSGSFVAVRGKLGAGLSP